MRKNILFEAGSTYQLMMACVASELYRRDDKKILLLHSHMLFTADLTDINDMRTRIIETNLFDEVLVLPVYEGKETMIRIESINLKEIDRFYFSNIGSVYSRFIYNHLSNKAKLILVQEGQSIYNIFDCFCHLQKFDPSLKIENINLNKLDKILLTGKEAYQSQKKEIVDELDISQIKDINLFFSKLNKIFNYKYEEIKERNIFMTNNFVEWGYLDKDSYIKFITKLQNALENDLAFRLHPFDSNYRLFHSMGIKILGDPIRTPWEIIAYNHLINDKLENKNIISVYSSALVSAFSILRMLKSNLLSNLNNNIYLMDIFAPYIANNKQEAEPVDMQVRQIIQDFKEHYGYEYHIPKTFDELKEYVKKPIY